MRTMAQVDHSQTTNSGLPYVIGCWHGETVSPLEKQNALAASCHDTSDGLTKQDSAVLRALSGQVSRTIRYSIPRPFANSVETRRGLSLQANDNQHANSSRNGIRKTAATTHAAVDGTASHVSAGHKTGSTADEGCGRQATSSNLLVQTTPEAFDVTKEEGFAEMKEGWDVTDFGGFPADSRVVLATSKRKIRLDQLRVRDAIKTSHVLGKGPGEEAPTTRGGVGEVIFFSTAHSAESVRHTGSYLYLTLKTSSNHSVTMGPAQYLALNGILAPAHTARLGDMVILGDGGSAVVTNVVPTRRRSRYAPHVGAADGFLVVDGVVVDGFAADTPRTALGVIEAFYRACSASVCTKALGCTNARRVWAALIAPL